MGDEQLYQSVVEFDHQFWLNAHQTTYEPGLTFMRDCVFFTAGKHEPMIAETRIHRSLMVEQFLIIGVYMVYCGSG